MADILPGNAAEKTGKFVRGRLYIHIEAIHELDTEIQQHVIEAELVLRKVRGEDFNVVKYDAEQGRVSLLNYEHFFDNPFPVLLDTWGIDLNSAHRWKRSFREVKNPPILHRKELLLSRDHPRYEEYADLTKLLDKNRLLQARGIGTKCHWYQHLDRNGFRVENNSLIATQVASKDEVVKSPSVQRHRTALTRYDLSVPMQSLLRAGYLEGTFTLLDYGCGKGDDVRILDENGISATGWDPHFCPDAPCMPADLVNLGFVVNVIEDPSERAATLESAYELADRLLVVSAMLTDRRAEEGTTHEDGVLTRRNTFQKYFSQSELAGFIESVLDEEPITAGPGIFYVFKDKLEEQRFLSRRYQNRSGFRKLLSNRRALSRTERDQQLYKKHQVLLDSLWEQWLKLGRQPDLLEVDGLAELEEGLGSLRRALRFLERHFGPEQLEEAASRRREDLLVYFALQQFERRRPYKQLPDELRRDVKAFFGSYAAAREAGQKALFLTGSSENIEEACNHSAAQGDGWSYHDTGFYVAAQKVPSLPAILRIYIQCGVKLYGDIDAIDLVKIHIKSRKLTLMRFDDFEGVALPRMLERIKIRLVNQSIQFFGYGGEYEPPYLYMKSRFQDSDSSNYDRQLRFDDKLQALGLFSFEEYGPNKNDFDLTLEKQGFEIEGFEIRRKGASKLDDSCGKYLTFRDLIECGETQERTGVTNLPKESETYEALWQLATKVLDPVMNYFGGIKLTYGFCSAELGQAIKRDIAPKLDQHAAHERNRMGNLVCERLGAAADFIVPDESMHEVAMWLAENTPYDRLYIYGDDLPLHVSAGPEQNGEIIYMINKITKNGVPRRIPKRITIEQLSNMKFV